MTDMIRFILSAGLTLFGLFALISAVLGLFRFKYVMNRMHAAALVDTVGALCMLLGLMIAFGLDIATLKIIVALIFLWMSSPVCSHLVARLEITINDELDSEMNIADERAVLHEKEGD